MKDGNINLESGHDLLIWTRKSKHLRWYYSSREEREIQHWKYPLDLNKDDGIGTLIRAVDSVFLKEEGDRNHDSVTRDISVAVTDYIIDFQQRYNKMRKYDMVLPDAVLAFKFLDTACLDGGEKQLALTACTVVTFAPMKSALKILLGEKTSVAPITDGMQVSDAAYYTEAE